MANLGAVDEDQLQELRRNNLADWVRTNGGPAALCRARGLSKSYPSYISQTINGGSFAARGARNAEAQLGMPNGWLDEDHSHSVTLQSPTPAGAEQSLPQPLQKAVVLVAAALGNLTTGQWKMVRARLDDLAGHPEAIDDVVGDVLPLLAGPETPSGKQRDAA